MHLLSSRGALGHTGLAPAHNCPTAAPEVGASLTAMAQRELQGRLQLAEQQVRLVCVLKAEAILNPHTVCPQVSTICCSVLQQLVWCRRSTTATRQIGSGCGLEHSASDPSYTLSNTSVVIDHVAVNCLECPTLNIFGS